MTHSYPTRRASDLIRSIEHRLQADADEAELLTLIDSLNADPSVHGILVQLPLPKGMNAAAVLDRIVPTKDVDGFTPVNVGRLSSGTGGQIGREWCREREWQ